jgi:hypothetical protein
VRERISWELSGFFENVESFWPNLMDEEGRVKTDQTIDFIRKQLMDFDESTDYASAWFDRELKNMFNIDIYAYPFNHDDGFIIIRENNVEVLVIRLEDLDRSFETAVTEFLELDHPVKMEKSNVGIAKKYSKEYGYVMRNITFPKSVCTRIYSSKYSKHFYTESMRNGFIQKWSGDRN